MTVNRSIRPLIAAVALSSLAGLSLAATPAAPAAAASDATQSAVSAPAKKHVKKHSVRTQKKSTTTRAHAPATAASKS